MARGQANLASDIDLRISLADTAYTELWEADRGPLLRGLGEYLLLENTFVRALTAEGIIVDLWAYRTSELPTLELYEWTTLLWRVPADTPALTRLPPRTPAETWPDERLLTVEDVRNLTNLFLMLLAEAPAPLYNGELHSARFQLDDVRTELVKLMYRQLGLRYAKRFEHFSGILPPAFLTDLERTYMLPGAAPLDPGAMAAAYVALFEVLGEHLQALSDQAGGGFEPRWYWRLHQQTNAKFRAFEREAAVD